MKLKKKHIWITLAGLVIIAAVSGAALRGHGSKGAEVQTAKVERKQIIQKVSATGKIQPKTQVEISADVSAKILKLPVVEGQSVKKGQFLVGLDRERYLAAVESAEARVSSAWDPSSRRTSFSSSPTCRSWKPRSTWTRTTSCRWPWGSPRRSRWMRFPA